MKSKDCHIIFIGDETDEKFRIYKKWGEDRLAEFFIVSKVYLWEIIGAKHQMIVYKASEPPIIKFKNN